METKGNDLDCLEATELRLGLPGTNSTSRPNKRQSPFSHDETKPKSIPSDQEVVPPAITQVVGWPPVRSFRKNALQAKKNESDSQPGLFVKVSMDGAPYLRKIDLNNYKGYNELHHALDVMFKCFSTGETCGKECRSEFAITYEDKDGDWMLVGDVPWEMFTSSCKRLRIMKGSEAKGLEPKC